MTDLPRQIPTNPAEQERLMPEWVKEEVCRLWFWKSPLSLTQHDSGIFAHALTIWQWCPEPVDPDEELAVDMLQTVWRHGTPSRSVVKDLLVEAIKRGRALERGEG